MQSINLIPQQEVQEQTQEKAVKISTLFSIGVLVIACGFALFFFLRTKNFKSQIKTLDAEIADSRQQISALSQIEVNARNLDKKYSTLKDLYSNRTLYSKLSTELKARIPEGVQVESMTIQREAMINITGFADNYIVIAAFTNNLIDKEYKNGDPTLKGLFKSVTLNSVNLEKSRNAVSFSINIEIDKNLLRSK